ncbi:ubiquilin-1-like [Platysternon megacephalum]|uniref:Ubiquilin-1-like n=1 Tax=Platysternon megacephalum TaxID=55544 RepID=A0A4D9DPP5_9SAUR|nr:ubiquilin-1-like [Platysternon megacephalum]
MENAAPWPLPPLQDNSTERTRLQTETSGHGRVPGRTPGWQSGLLLFIPSSPYSELRIPASASPLFPEKKRIQGASPDQPCWCSEAIYDLCNVLICLDLPPGV